MKCLQCGSADIVRDVRAVDQSHVDVMDLKLQVYTDPGAMIFKGARDFPMLANVCVDCGFVMLFVETHHAQRIKQIHGSGHPLDR